MKNEYNTSGYTVAASGDWFTQNASEMQQAVNEMESRRQMEAAGPKSLSRVRRML